MATNQIPRLVPFLRGVVLATSLIGSGTALADRPAISEDRELKQIDLAGWDCRDRLEGTAKTPDGIERNKLKNRAPTDLGGLKFPQLDFAAFLQAMAAFDAQTKGMHRKDISGIQQEQLDPMEKQIVSFTGYLVLAYAGPPESTNCASTDFHDWHLELFEQPLDHAPQIGDPTPIICEITPRTQNGVFRDHVRLQALAGFIRAPDMTIEPTGHPARKIRVTGYLLWDDEHNGAADIGTVIRLIAANKYHQPWRRTAWEIHPAIKIEAVDASTVTPAVSAAPPRPPATVSFPPPTSVPSSPRASLPPPQQQQFVTVTTPVKIKILYGETVIPQGTRLRIVSQDAQSVTVSYLDGTYAIPISSTDFR
jgi:hypothetical protein